MFAGPRQPGADGAFAVPKHTRRRSDREPFGERTQDFRNSGGSCFEAIERRIATGGEGRSAGLTAKGLDAFILAVRPIADQGVNVRVGDPVIGAGRVRAGESVGGDAFRSTTSALEFAPWTNRWRWYQRRWRPGALASARRAIVGRARVEQALAGR